MTKTGKIELKELLIDRGQVIEDGIKFTAIFGSSSMLVTKYQQFPNAPYIVLRTDCKNRVEPYSPPLIFSPESLDECRRCLDTFLYSADIVFPILETCEPAVLALAEYFVTEVFSRSYDENNTEGHIRTWETVCSVLRRPLMSDELALTRRMEIDPRMLNKAVLALEKA